MLVFVYSDVYRPDPSPLIGSAINSLKWLIGAYVLKTISTLKAQIPLILVFSFQAYVKLIVPYIQMHTVT